MKILLIEPGKVPRSLEIDPSLESMQKLVGGPIQAVYPFEELVALICHEEGKLLGLPLNRGPEKPGDRRDLRHHRRSLLPVLRPSRFRPFREPDRGTAGTVYKALPCCGILRGR